MSKNIVILRTIYLRTAPFMGVGLAELYLHSGLIYHDQLTFYSYLHI